MSLILYILRWEFHNYKEKVVTSIRKKFTVEEFLVLFMTEIRQSKKLLKYSESYSS